MFDIIIGAVAVIGIIALIVRAAVWVVDKASPVSFSDDDLDLEVTDDDFPEFWERGGSWYVRSTDNGYEYNPNYTTE